MPLIWRGSRRFAAGSMNSGSMGSRHSRKRQSEKLSNTKENIMNDQTVMKPEPADSLSKVVSVKAPQEVAWRVFTEKMGTWWPLATHKIGKAAAVDAVIEPRVGGRWYERGEDGSTCDWGRVLAWEPPSRLVLSWDINADFQYDPVLNTELEIR